MKNEQDDNSIVGRTVGRYRVLSLIATGGMGEMFLAEDTRLERANPRGAMEI